MQTNAWNLHCTKQRLQIIERTKAHKKHLISILNAKSKIDSHCNLRPRQTCNSPRSNTHTKLIQKDNQSMIKRLVNINKLRHHYSQNNFNGREWSRNLKDYSSVNRSIRMRQIYNQNCKIFSRLITTSSTIKIQQLMKRNIETSKYKENLHRNKYLKPDYSEEACKIIIRIQPKFKILNLSQFSTRSSSKLQKQFRSRIV